MRFKNFVVISSGTRNACISYFACSFLITYDIFCFFRICGNTASSKDIHGTVSAQLKKNFAKSRWRVSTIYLFDYFPSYLSYIERNIRILEFNLNYFRKFCYFFIFSKRLKYLYYSKSIF